MIPSITAIESASWGTPLVLRGSYRETIPQAARLGYPGIELHLKDSRNVDRGELKRILSENGVRLTSIGTGPSYSQERVFLTHDREEIRREAMLRMKGHVELAAETGAVVIIGLMKGQMKDVEQADRYQDRLDCAMKELLTHAEKQGVGLTFEVIDRFESDWLNTIDDGLKFIGRYGSPNLSLHLDTFHMNIEEGNLADAIMRAGKNIGHVHVADSDRWYPGHAHYDFAETFDALRRVGYQGAVALESFLYPDPETAAVRSLEVIGPLCRDR